MNISIYTRIHINTFNHFCSFCNYKPVMKYCTKARGNTVAVKLQHSGSVHTCSHQPGAFTCGLLCSTTSNCSKRINHLSSDVLYEVVQYCKGQFFFYNKREHQHFCGSQAYFRLIRERREGP